MGADNKGSHLTKEERKIIAKGIESGATNEWAREVQFSVDMNLLGLEDFLRQEADMMCAVTPPQCEKAAEADRQAIENLMAVLASGPSIQEKLDAILAAKSATESPPRSR